MRGRRERRDKGGREERGGMMGRREGKDGNGEEGGGDREVG